MFDFNDKAYRYVLFPVGRVYNDFPDPARDGIHNALENLGEPVIFMNKVLQGQPGDAATSVARFLINSVFGLGGFIDVASHNGIQEPTAGDFGATLYSYGVGEGPYLVLPLFGPSNPRDTIGKIADSEADPFGYVAYSTYPEQFMIAGVKGVDQIAGLMDNYLEARRTSLDFYAFLRSSYRQNRRFEVSGKAETEEDLYANPGGGDDHP